MTARAAVLRRSSGWILAGALLVLLGAVARAGEDAARIQRLQSGVDEAARRLEATHGEGSPVARRRVAELLARIRSEHGISLRDPLARSKAPEASSKGESALARRRFDAYRTAAERRWGKDSARTRHALTIAKAVLERRYGTSLPSMPELTKAERYLLCHEGLERMRAHLDAQAVSTETRTRCLRVMRRKLETRHGVRIVTRAVDDAPAVKEPVGRD